MADFGKLLDEWESKKKGSTKRARNNMESFLDKYPPESVEKNDNNVELPAEKRSRLRRISPQASLDLHGLTIEKSRKAMDGFLKQSVQSGLEKVMIVHGKGNHSSKGGVLKDYVGKYLSDHPYAGEVGFAKREDGGSGARWVILRKPGNYRSR